MLSDRSFRLRKTARKKETAQGFFLRFPENRTDELRRDATADVELHAHAPDRIASITVLRMHLMHDVSFGADEIVAERHAIEIKRHVNNPNNHALGSFACGPAMRSRICCGVVAVGSVEDIPSFAEEAFAHRERPRVLITLIPHRSLPVELLDDAALILCSIAQQSTAQHSTAQQCIA